MKILERQEQIKMRMNDKVLKQERIASIQRNIRVRNKNELNRIIFHRFVSDIDDESKNL